ncbi:MAG TPA: Hsp20/alpha crystallin family protein [Angustibacter sp.]|nr:Hsp20/alpha crystallin family protein [Angustibacter sp.]
MTAVTKRTATSPLTELFDWIESGWPGMAELRRESAHMMRIEDRMDDGQYVIRAELPGIDPEKDVEISVSDGVLTISAERREEVSEKGRSEFHYGSFVRRVTLPTGYKEDELSAHYNDGILEVDVPLEESKPATRMIPIARGPSE